jgi:hypothetical protein
MFCDADDMFRNVCGLYIIFREFAQGFDSLISCFMEETKNPQTGEHIYINHEMDSTFVHGKVHRRQYLIDNHIRWNDKLTIHEDSYFNYMATTLADDPNTIKYTDAPIYLWKWRDESVCRHDPLYMQKTYNNYIDSITALVEQLIGRKKDCNADILICSQMFDTYYLMNTNSWLQQDNQSYRIATEKRFKKFYNAYKDRFDNLGKGLKMSISNQVRADKINSGMEMEKQTFEQWIEYIKGL